MSLLNGVKLQSSAPRNGHSAYCIATLLNEGEHRLPVILQGDRGGREKAFVEIKVGSFGYQLGSRAARVTAHAHQPPGNAVTIRV